MAISPETLQIFEKDKTAKIIKTEDGTPHLSLSDLIQIIVNSLIGKLYEDIEMDGSRHKRTILIDETQYDPPIFIEGRNGQLHRIGKIKIEVDCYYEYTVLIQCYVKLV